MRRGYHGRAVVRIFCYRLHGLLSDCETNGTSAGFDHGRLVVVHEQTHKTMKTLMLIAVSAFVAAASNASAADGSALFSKQCAKCHGADGKGDTKMGKKLKIKDLTVEVGKLSDARIAASIKEGVKENGKLRMKPIKGLSDADVDAVVKFVKTLK